MFKRYKPFFKAGAMDLMAFKFQIFTWLFISALQIAAVVFLWIAIYKNSPNGMDSVINGFTFKEMIVYLVFSNIFAFVTFGGDTLWIMNEDIKKGTIAMQFTKPISYRGRFLFQSLGSAFVAQLIFGLPLFIISYLVFYFTGFISIVSWWDLLLHILLFLMAQIFANILNDTINYICGVLCFYTSSGWGINQTKQVVVAFLSGAALPLSFFPAWAGNVVNYLPFAGMTYNPVIILLGKASLLESVHYVGFSLAWVVMLNLFASMLFYHASKKVTVQGG